MYWQIDRFWFKKETALSKATDKKFASGRLQRLLLTYPDGLAVHNLFAPKVEAERAGDGCDHADSAGVARIAGVTLALWDVPCTGTIHSIRWAES